MTFELHTQVFADSHINAYDSAAGSMFMCVCVSKEVHAYCQSVGP